MIIKTFWKVIITEIIARISCNIVRFDPLLDVSFKEESHAGLPIVKITIMLINVTEYGGRGFVFEVGKRSFS